MMKSPNTILVERAMAKREMPADPLAEYRASAAAELGVPVVDAALFTRQSSDVARRLAGGTTFGGPLARLALKKVEQARAGGLPEHFLLAVVGDDVVALERKFKPGRGDGVGEPRGEVARWRRGDLDVGVEDKGHLLHVTLAAPSQDETVHCSVLKFAATEAFVALLAKPGA